MLIVDCESMSIENINFFVKILLANDYAASKIHKLLHLALGAECIKERRIRQLVTDFKTGRRENVEDGRKMNLGRPSITKTPEMIERVTELITEDDRLSVRAIEARTGIPKTIVHVILQQECGLKCVVAKWIPYVLSDVQKANRVAGCHNLLEILPRRLMKDRLFVVDEKWIYLKSFPPQNSVHRWVPCDAVGPAGDRPTICRKSMCHKKVMIIVALNFSGQTYFEILEDGGTINSGRYIDFLLNCFDYLREQHGIAIDRLSLMHDNARPHKSAVVENFLDQMVVTKVRQPAYSPDVNLLDRYVFRNLENARRSHDFETVVQVRDYVQNFLQSLTREALNKEFDTLRRDCNLIIEAGGNYL